MSLKQIGKKVAIVGGAVTTIGAAIIATPVLGPIGVIIVAGATVTEAVTLTGVIVATVGGTIVALSED